MSQLWAEHYRPRTLADIVLDDEVRFLCEKWVMGKDIPHLLLYGPPGLGKTSLAKILAESLSATILEFNASDDRGISVVREQVKGFVQSFSMDGNRKIVFFDEADALTPAAQQSLRNMMETYSGNARFIFSANISFNIIDAIHSRCTCIHFEQPPVEQIHDRLKQILDTEKFMYDESTIGNTIKRYYPDIRAMISYLQDSAQDFRIVEKDVDGSAMPVIDALSSYRLDGIRELIRGRDLVHIYNQIYDNLSRFPKPARPQIVVSLAKAVRVHKIAADPELSLMGCVVEIIEECLRWV